MEKFQRLAVYFCGRFERQAEFRAKAEGLVVDGFDVVSSWLWEGPGDGTDDHVPPINTEAGRRRRAAFAGADLNQIHAADVVVAFAEPVGTLSRGGRHVEAGAAIAWGKTVLVVGGIESDFYCVDAVEHRADWSDAVERLQELAEEKRRRPRSRSAPVGWRDQRVDDVLAMAATPRRFFDALPHASRIARRTSSAAEDLRIALAQCAALIRDHQSPAAIAARERVVPLLADVVGVSFEDGGP